MLVGWPPKPFISIHHIRPIQLDPFAHGSTNFPKFLDEQSKSFPRFFRFLQSKPPNFPRVLTFFRTLEDPLTLDADACVTFCELSVPVVARLCEVLGLPGPSGCHWKTMGKNTETHNFSGILYDFSGTWCRFYEWDLTLPQKLGFAFAWDFTTHFKCTAYTYGVCIYIYIIYIIYIYYIYLTIWQKKLTEVLYQWLRICVDLVLFPLPYEAARDWIPNSARQR